MLTTAVKLCRSIVFQMWLNNNIKTFYTSLTRRVTEPTQEWVKTNVGIKRLLIGFVVLLLLLYFWPFGRNESRQLLLSHKWLGATQRPVGPAEVCVDSKLEPFLKRADIFNVFINHFPSLLPQESSYLPFIGNGYLGIVVDKGQSLLYIRVSRSLSVPIHFYPVVEVTDDRHPEDAAIVLDIVNGLIRRIQCFELGDDCIEVDVLSYAHRRRPSVLIQEIKIRNPTGEDVILDLRQIAVSEWQGAVTHTKRINSGRAEDVSYGVTSGVVEVDSAKIAVVVFNLKLPETVTVKASSSWSYHMVTVVRYQLLEKKEDADAITKQLNEQVEKEFSDVVNIESKMLRREHTNIWTALWSSGFGISYSRAAGALNGDKINMTFYYVMSSVPSPLFELGHERTEVGELERLLYFPDRCYDGHHTMQNPKMWKDVTSMEDLRTFVNTWLLTLEKQGCGRMIKAGADGVLQAMILSCGAFKFSDDHLEFGTHPSDLHRDYFFRRINYGNDTHVNVSVRVGDDNRAVLYVSLDRNNKPYYACDAGCLDQHVQLSREVVTFPVKLTDPLTSILYITSDKQHMEELKHTIHVREIVEAPAHEHHVMVLHKHGHHWGGLPMLFWGTIGILILIFHLFLFKLVYNEYCSGVEPKYPKYTTRGRSYV